MRVQVCVFHTFPFLALIFFFSDNDYFLLTIGQDIPLVRTDALASTWTSVKTTRGSVTVESALTQLAVTLAVAAMVCCPLEEALRASVSDLSKKRKHAQIS